MKSVTNNRLTTSKGLLQYQLLMRSITHLDDISDIDKRMLFPTIFVEDKKHLEGIHKPIYKKLNGYITKQSRKICPTSPALYLSDDVEGSRNNRPQLINPISPHMHGILVIPNNINITGSYLVGMEHAIADMREIRNISPTWDVDIVLSNKTQFRDIFLDRIKQKHPEIKSIGANTNTHEYTLSISRDYLTTTFDLSAFMFDIKSEHSEIHSYNVRDKWQSVDIRRYNYKESIFKMCGYASKLTEQMGHSSSGTINYKSTIHPFESNMPMKANTGMKLLNNDNAHLLAQQVLQNPSMAFSDEYLALHGAELNEMRDQARRTKMWASNVGKAITRQIPVGKPRNNGRIVHSS